MNLQCLNPKVNRKYNISPSKPASGFGIAGFMGIKSEFSHEELPFNDENQMS
jgi:hypothetical protein